MPHAFPNIFIHIIHISETLGITAFAAKFALFKTENPCYNRVHTCERKGKFLWQTLH